MGNCDLLSVPIRFKLKCEGQEVGTENNLEQDTTVTGEIGHESVAAHFTSFV